MAERSNISIAVVAEKRSLVIKIDGYSATKRLLEIGQSVNSSPFSVGGHQWFVAYYPNGRTASGCISFFLVLDSADAKDEVRAKVRFNLLHKDGRTPVPPLSRSTVERVFRASDQVLFLNAIRHRDLEGSGHLIDNCFSIRCKINVFKDPTQKCHQFVEVPPSNLHQHLGDLLNSTDGADVTFHVGGETFSAHRSVLAVRSSVFKAELLGGMKENLGDPIKIDDMEAWVFKSLLSFIYTDSLPLMTREGTDEGATPADVVTASHLLVAADRYNIERLKLICEEKLCSCIDSAMVATSLVLAEQHSCHGLKEACLQFLASPSNLKAMVASDGYEHLKRSCPAVLRELIARLLPVELKVAKDIVMSI
ncbi:hypothetical protein BRADI_4g23730v3 [Brachypodium distachyon]|uniref:BTB domain-containing protein n=1 Tax=Brachypodium distachyon TaxID=15368 RepID=I1IMX9_BRADI|nr:hypothetical protein BRADI_4g23730v3 [Brachypodium distachyon]